MAIAETTGLLPRSRPGVASTSRTRASRLKKALRLRQFRYRGRAHPKRPLRRSVARPGDAGTPCQSPHAPLTLRATPQTIVFANLQNGAPQVTVDPAQIVGFQWLINPDASGVAYAADIALDDLTFDPEPGAGPEAAVCPLGDGVTP